MAGQTRVVVVERRSDQVQRPVGVSGGEPGRVAQAGQHLDLGRGGVATVSYTCSGNRAELSNGYVSWPLTKVS